MIESVSHDGYYVYSPLESLIKGDKKMNEKNQKEELREKSKKFVIKQLEEAIEHLREAELECGSRLFPQWQIEEKFIRETREKIEEMLREEKE